MLRCLIIDDEQDGRDVLNMLITDYCPELLVAEVCTNGRDGVKAILKHQPDIVFLDIDMPDMSGFDVLDCVKTQKLKVIFVTAHNEHAIRAFKYSAIDYILKPPSPQSIIEAVEKAKLIEFKNSASQYDLLINQLKNEEHVPDVIALPLADGLQVVKVQDIMYGKADRNYTNIHFADKKKMLVSKQLKEFESLLTPNGFFRIHHSALINLRYISKYVRGEGGYVVMKDDSTIEVSRQKKEEFLRLINKV
jgi:two-component system, LytTR family, response regulator